MKHLSVLLVSLGMLSMTACIDKDLAEGPAKDAERVQDLKVSENFDWQTTREVTCNVASAAIAQVSVSETATGSPFASFFAGGELASAPVSLNIPAATETLYLTYATASGEPSVARAVNVSGNAVAFSVGADSRPFDDSDMEQAGGVVYIPARANGWATMMFEDQWPGYGDYDFNDVVFNYKVQLYLTGRNKVEAMQIGMRVKALSGSLPYEVFLRMHGLETKNIGDIELVGAKNIPADVTPALTLIEPIDPTKDRPIFRFEGIRKNLNKQPGAIWTNTEPGYELSEDQLVDVAFMVYFEEPVNLSQVNFAGLDFFLARTDGGQFGPEIHRCNYEPINESAYYGADQKNLHARNYYMSKDNLIWAVNIPVNIPHTYEKTDFLKAYPEFKTWAQSGGMQAKDWYEASHRVAKYLVSK